MAKKAKIIFDASVAGKAKVGFVQFGGIECIKLHREMWEEIHQLETEYRHRFSAPADALEFLKPARKLYHQFNMEPTRFRPSSEALLRRVIKEKALYQINSIVDLGNYASLYYLLPIGLYDMEKLRGKILFRLGQPGEEYQGIGKDMIHVAERLTLADDLGPFGNPSADSARSKIDDKSREVLLVIFAHADFPDNSMQQFIEFARTKMIKFHPGAAVVSSGILA